MAKVVFATVWTLILLFGGTKMWAQPVELRLPTGHFLRIKPIKSFANRSTNSAEELKQYRDIDNGARLKWRNGLLLYAPSLIYAKTVAQHFKLGEIKKIAEGIFYVHTPEHTDVITLCQKIDAYNAHVYALPNWERDRHLRYIHKEQYINKRIVR